MSDFFNEWFYGSSGDDDDSQEPTDDGSWIGGQGGYFDDPNVDEDFMGNEVTLYDLSMEPVSYTRAEWMDLAYLTSEELNEEYNQDNLNILYQLDELGLMSDEDWAEWRERYATLYPERAQYHISVKYGR